MTEEKKEHHLTRAKRLREEAQITEVTEEVSTPEIVELEKKVAKLEKSKASRPYHVFNSRASIVAYCDNEEEADKVLSKYEGGWKQMI